MQAPSMVTCKTWEGQSQREGDMRSSKATCCYTFPQGNSSDYNVYGIMFVWVFTNQAYVCVIKCVSYHWVPVGSRIFQRGGGGGAISRFRRMCYSSTVQLECMHLLSYTHRNLVFSVMQHWSFCHVCVEESHEGICGVMKTIAAGNLLSDICLDNMLIHAVHGHFEWNF
jgi:hypothetical protein